MNFERAVDIVLSHEGGYVFDPHDPGGETNYGISKRAFPELDIKNLTREHAIEIYRKAYWEPLLPLLLPPALRLCAFDCAVNQGLSRSIKWLQGAVGVKQDGYVGRETIEALSIYGDKEALSRFVQYRVDHYSRLPNWGRYGAGWMRRLLLVTIETLSPE